MLKPILEAANSARISNSSSICWTQIHLKMGVGLRRLSKPISKRNLIQSDNQFQLRLPNHNTNHKADRSPPIATKLLKLTILVTYTP